MKKFLSVAALSLFSLAVLSAKTYNLTLSNPVKAGSVKLKPGHYNLKVEGSNAIFTEVGKSTSFTTPVKVEATDKKFEDTRVHSAKDGADEKITEIELGGSKTKLGF